MILQTYFIPGIDPVLDILSTIGFGIGLIGAIYLREMKHAPMPIWFPFAAVAVVFALLGAEGGALDIFGPGVMRILALLSLISAEVVGITAAIDPEKLQ